MPATLPNLSDSLVCYVVGLGDRHLNNILIDKATGELVHIDLGMIFEYSKRALTIPERVPFRLTRDIVDPILVEGINARFKHVAVHVLEKLQENSQVIIGIASILLHDPISTFGGGVNSTTDGRNVLAETAISRLRSKLEGRDLSLSNQSVEQQVRFNCTLKQSTPPDLGHSAYQRSKGSEESQSTLCWLDAIHLVDGCEFGCFK